MTTATVFGGTTMILRSGQFGFFVSSECVEISSDPQAMKLERLGYKSDSRNSIGAKNCCIGVFQWTVFLL